MVIVDDVVMKNCSKCKEAKELTEFYKQASKKDGLQSHCKACERARHSKYRENNAVKISIRQKQYRQDHPEKIKQYQVDNKDLIREIKKKYWIDNRDKINKQRREKKKNDPAFKLICNQRTAMNAILNGRSKCASQLELLGCTPEQYRQHMEAQFTEGMTWDNHGEWHQDHIIPASSCDYDDPEQVKVCWHYTNFQPMWAEENWSKSNKVIVE